MNAIILAAGIASRMGAAANGRPKCLLPVGDRTILEWQLAALRAAGIESVTVVVGHNREAVEALSGGLGFRTLYNPDYATTNDIASLGLAAQEMRGDFVYLHGDVLLDPSILSELVRDPRPLVLVVDTEAGDGESENVHTSGERVLEVGKDIPPERWHGEFIGIALLRTPVLATYRATLGELIEAGRVGDYCTVVLNRLIQAGTEIGLLRTAGRRWIEVDFPDELQRARELFAPERASGSG